jgi:hypothetical protein
MANKIKFVGNGDEIFKNEIHFTSPIGSDYTLCGLTLDGDPNTCGQYEKTNKNVDCKDCQMIVDFSKNIKKTWKKDE